MKIFQKLQYMTFSCNDYFWSQTPYLRGSFYMILRVKNQGCSPSSKVEIFMKTSSIFNFTEHIISNSFLFYLCFYINFQKDKLMEAMFTMSHQMWNNWGKIEERVWIISQILLVSAWKCENKFVVKNSHIRIINLHSNPNFVTC